MSSIRDLARHLNISIGTVSRALNGRADVNANTRQRVLAAAAKLSYAPNLSGRNLRRGATHAVAFMLQPHPGDQQYGEPFFIPFLKGLQAKLAERGLDLIVLMGAPGDYQQERLRRVVEARWADAVVLAWTRRKDERIDYLTEVGFPFATLGRSRSGGGAYPSLDLDFERAGEAAVDRLVAAGHRRIAAIGQSLGLNFGYLFLAGYRRGSAAARHRAGPATHRSRQYQRGGRLRGYAERHQRQRPADRDHLQQRRDGARRLQGADRDGHHAGA